MEQRGLGTVREERASRGKEEAQGMQHPTESFCWSGKRHRGPTEEAESWRAMKASVLGAQAPTSGVRTE